MSAEKALMNRPPSTRRIVDTSKALPRVEPELVARALGAEFVCHAPSSPYPLIPPGPMRAGRSSKKDEDGQQLHLSL